MSYKFYKNKCFQSSWPSSIYGTMVKQYYRLKGVTILKQIRFIVQ